MSLQSIKQSFNEKKGEQKKLLKELSTLKKDLSDIERQITVSEKASNIIQLVAQATQNELQYRICEPVTLALNAVYPEDPYRMVADFQLTVRGVTECVLGFERNGFVNSPLQSAGGGPTDVASFALRVGSWSLQNPRPRGILCLDEPMKWVSRNKMELAGQMLKEISEKLGLQIIMISHIPELISCADKIIEVGIKNGKSYLIN